MANRKKRMSKDPLAQLGIVIPNLDEDDDEGDDDDLEAELKDLLSGKEIKPQPRTYQKKSLNVVDIEKIAMECIEDINDEGNEDDPISDEDELLAQLHDLTSANAPTDNVATENSSPEKMPETVSDSSVDINMLQDRLNLYKQALEVAKQCNDASKCRRYVRAIKTLENLMKSAKSGNVIKEEDVPPAVSIPKPKTSINEDVPPAVTIPKPKTSDTEKSEARSPEKALPLPREPESIPPYTSSSPAQAVSDIQSQLKLRRDQYKLAAIKAKKSGDIETAMNYVKIVKKFDAVIAAEANGEPVDLTNMPPEIAIQSNSKELSNVPHVTPSEIRTEGKAQIIPAASELEAAAMEAAKEPVDPSLFKVPPPPSSALEALEQRLQRYCSTRDAAKAEGNSSKARRLQRIVQQYENAIKQYKIGKTLNFEELPCPPGFPPIPVSSESTSTSSSLVKPKDQSHAEKPSDSKSHPHPKSSEPSTSSGKHPRIQRANTSSILDKQLRFLLERQKLFRQAALESKKKGDIQQAKHYLALSKGFESMIEATKNGLPIDSSTIPTPPQLEADFVIINKSEVSDNMSGEVSSSELFPTLEKELQHQIEMCCRNKEHFMRLGDVTSGSKFEKLALETKKDLAYLQHLWRSNEPVPIFHYETRLFSLVQCNTDLSDSEIEIAVERGINFPGKPDELDSFVRVEFAIPTECPQRAKTSIIKNNTNPEFKQNFKFEINRKSRSQMRQFKKPVLKFEVFSKGWFFKGDTLLGTVTIKLVELETKCSIHDCFDLMEGRKSCGGKLQVRIRIRDPLLVKQVEEVREKWLVIGN